MYQLEAKIKTISENPIKFKYAFDPNLSLLESKLWEIEKLIHFIFTNTNKGLRSIYSNILTLRENGVNQNDPTINFFVTIRHNPNTKQISIYLPEFVTKDERNNIKLEVENDIISA